MDDRQKWDKKYAAAVNAEATACWVLSEYAYLLPETGSAIDVASGRGGNALLLAAAGLQTTAIDVSPIALEQLQHAAKQKSLHINIRAEALTEDSLGIEQWDVIVVSNFLQRNLFPAIVKALKVDGLIYYQTFVKDKSATSVGPSNPDFLLDDNELLQVFSDLSVRVFIDLQKSGSAEHGLRDRSCIVAQKVHAAR